MTNNLLAPNEIEVHQARSSDSACLQSLYFELTGDDKVLVMPETIEAIFSDRRTCLLVAEMNGRICGTILVSLCMDAMYGTQPFAIVENVFVKDDVRHQGVGSRLMKYAEEFCLESDCTKVMLLSSSFRIGAHTFFEKMGFAGDKKCGFVKYRRDFLPLVQDIEPSFDDTPSASP